MDKKCQIVMLSTDVKAEGLGARNWYFPNSKKLIIDNLVSNLYILSDDEIKKGDFVYSILTHKIEVIQDIRTEVCFAHKKVIATTDTNLTKVAQIPQQFIKYYVSEYNKGNVITEVMVKYEEYADEELYKIKELKINPDNTINIKSVKESWNRNEVIELMEKAIDRGMQLKKDYKVIHKKDHIDKWIENNL